MCSVVGCDSWRRSAQRFRLPEDPERRLEWVQFLATVNKQRFKESSWTDIRVCSEHFTEDRFETRSLSGVTGAALKPGAVPSLCARAAADKPEHLERSTCEPVETTCQTDQLESYDDPTSYSEDSGLFSVATSRGVSCSTDTSDTFVAVHGQKRENVHIDLIREKAALLQMKGKYIVNEKRLLQLFSCKCPSCGSKVKMEKVTYGLLIVLNQRCLQCDYRNQWKSQVSAYVPSAESSAPPTDDTHSGTTGVSEIVAVIDEENDPTETEESSDQGDVDSDEDWKPKKHFLQAKELQKRPEDKREEEGDAYPPFAPKHSQLCTDCGVFFNRRKPHTCEHKMKPFSCNICGKRCVSEIALTSHSRIHDESYEHRCKYCHAAFKTKVDKHTHEQSHLTEGKPYECPDCSETFATNKERRLHLEGHRGPPQLKCHTCGIEFLWPLSLQRHLAVHTGERPFKCSVCQRGFNQASHLKSHMRLHTGERPYKCQLCDKRFNHNVSLKSHVQRHHVQGPGQKKRETNERESDNGDAEERGNRRCAGSGLDNVEEEQDTEEEGQRERTDRPKKKRKTTGRPVGRPKSCESGSSIPAVQVEGRCSDTKTGKQRGQRLKRKRGNGEREEDEPSDSEMSLESAEEGEETGKKATKIMASSKARQKHCDSDSEFDPEERKKKRNSSQNSGKSLVKRRGRPTKNPEG